MPPVKQPPPPETEKGYVIPEEQFSGFPSWGSFDLDALEYVPDLKWPRSLEVFDRMRSDPQIEALMRGMFLPIRRMRWEIDPNGTPARVHNRLADDLGLPVMGKKKRAKKRRNSFHHDDHLRLSMLALYYGHQWFEKVGKIEYENGRQFWRLEKVAFRPVHSIERIQVARDGGLMWVQQRDEQFPPKLTIDRLLWFAHEKEGSNWFGRSLMRAAYQPWILKDRLLRVDAIRHERNGMGVPIVELPERATDKQRAEAAALAQQYKTGVASGGALPFGMKLRLVGVEGTTSDVLASIRYHDEAMARLMLQ